MSVDPFPNEQREVTITPVHIIGITYCTVPVVPGTPETMRDGEPIPLDDRPEMCATNARWVIGMQPLCDHHLRNFCEVAGIDFADLLDEARRDFHEWPDGERDQARAVETRDHFAEVPRA